MRVRCKMLPLIEITRERLPGDSGRLSGRGRDPCSRQRPDPRIWNLYRKYAGHSGVNALDHPKRKNSSDDHFLPFVRRSSFSSVSYGKPTTSPKFSFVFALQIYDYSQKIKNHCMYKIFSV